jgi:two-component system chemotaxis sensor kinase CheA
LLPLKDQGNVLPDLEAGRQRGEEVLATVLICGDASRAGEQRVGMVVRQVLDVSAGTVLERDAVSEAAGLELALVKEKLTVVCREFGTKATTAWQEVA